MTATPLTLRPVTPLDPHTGFVLKHPYVEHVYAPVVGPTSILVLRRAALLFDAFPSGLQVDPTEFAESLGVGHRSGENSPLIRTLARLDRFNLASWDPGSRTLDVPTQVRAVPERWLRRLPESTQAVHASLIATLQTPTTPALSPPVPTGPAISMSLSR